MRNNNQNRKQILKCVMLSSYVILLSTFHSRSPERAETVNPTEQEESKEQEIQDREETKEQTSINLNSDYILIQENLFNKNTISNDLNLKSLSPTINFSVVAEKEQDTMECEEEKQETSESFNIDVPTDLPVVDAIKECSSTIVAEIESESSESEYIESDIVESKEEVAVAHEYEVIDGELNESTAGEILFEEINEDPELVSSIEYVEELALAEEQAEVIKEELPVLSKQQEAQTTERIYHPVDWEGGILTARKGVNRGPSGKETYYNLPMDGIVNMMHNLGYADEHWIREDGVHMLGEYVMVAANLSVHPRGSIVETSLGMGRVCDTGGFARKNPTQLDIATNW